MVFIGVQPVKRMIVSADSDRNVVSGRVRVALHLIVVIDTTAPSKLKSLWTGVLAVWAGSKDQVAPGN